MYALASGLKGFKSSTLRVRVTRTDVASGNVWVVTADLLDAGTALVLTRSQVSAIGDTCPDCLGQGLTVHWGAIASVTRPCPTCRPVAPIDSNIDHAAKAAAETFEPRHMRHPSFVHVICVG